MNREKPIRILLVDDEPAIRRALRTPLQELGFHTEEASRGEDALHLVRAQPFDVVLLDINMPGIGGIRTLERLRAFAPRLPILMLSVRDDEEDKVEALELGADDYITKPFSMRECLARIRSAVRRAQTPERPEDAPIRIGKIEVQPARRAVRKSGQPDPAHAQGIRHPLLSDGPRRARGDLWQAAHLRVGRANIAKKWIICAPSCGSCARRSRTIRLIPSTSSPMPAWATGSARRFRGFTATTRPWARWLLPVT